MPQNLYICTVTKYTRPVASGTVMIFVHCKHMRPGLTCQLFCPYHMGN